MAEFTDRLRLEKQATGANEDTWGERRNRGIDQTDAAIAGIVRIDLSLHGGGSYTLTTASGQEDQARHAGLDFFGGANAPVTVRVPSSSKLYDVRNTCGQDVTISSGVGVTATIENDTVARLAVMNNGVYFVGFPIATAAATDTGGTRYFNLGNIGVRTLKASKLELDSVGADGKSLSIGDWRFTCDTDGNLIISNGSNAVIRFDKDGHIKSVSNVSAGASV